MQTYEFKETFSHHVLNLVDILEHIPFQNKSLRRNILSETRREGMFSPGFVLNSAKALWLNTSSASVSLPPWGDKVRFIIR
jgi:hypothetical protein